MTRYNLWMSEADFHKLKQTDRASCFWSSRAGGQGPSEFSRRCCLLSSRTPPRPQIFNIDAQPWPDREAVDIERYVRTWREHHGQGSVSLIAARGCPYHCRWCSPEVFGKTHR